MYPAAINIWGDVVGWATSPLWAGSFAFLYNHSTGQLRVICPGTALGINAQGEVVGDTTGGGFTYRAGQFPDMLAGVPGGNILLCDQRPRSGSRRK